MQLSINAPESLAIIDKYIIYSKTDLQGIITEVSTAFSNISGYTKDELIGQSHSIVRHPENSPDFFQEIWKTIQSGKSWQGEIRNRRKDGRSYYVYSTIEPARDVEGYIVGYISTRQDITHQKIAEEQKEILIHQSRLASMGEMLNNITHQWRQPLSGLYLKIQILQERNNTQTAYDFQKEITIMSEIIKHMNQTIDDFTNFFKPSKSVENFSPREAIEHIHSILKSKLIEHRIDFELNEKSTITIQGLKNEFMQVVMNMLSNACDQIISTQTADGKIMIFIERKGENHIRLRFRDNAGGIPEELLPDKLFERYISTKGDKGTGIGLFMSKMIINEHMGGKIWAHNTNGGAEFNIVLPLTPESGHGNFLI